MIRSFLRESERYQWSMNETELKEQIKEIVKEFEGRIVERADAPLDDMVLINTTFIDTIVDLIQQREAEAVLKRENEIYDSVCDVCRDERLVVFSPSIYLNNLANPTESEEESV